MIQDDVFGYSCLQTMLLGEQPKFVGQYQGLFDVVGGKQNGFLLFHGQPMKQMHDFDTAYHIQESCRFIEKNERTFLYQGLGNHHLLTLPVGKFGGITTRFVGDTHVFHGFLDDALVLLAEATEKAGMRLSTQTYQLIHTQSTGKSLVGQYHPNGAGAFLFGIFCQWFSQYIERSTECWLRSGKRAEQCRLPRAVGTQ